MNAHSITYIVGIVMTFTFRSFFAEAQETVANAKVSAILIDSITNRPVPFASVMVYRLPEKTFISGVISKDDGQFSVDNIRMGNYRIVISSVGYRTREIAVEIKSLADGQLREIKLSPDAGLLKDVVVTTTKDAIEQKVDRMVYNPAGNISAAGGDAADVLRNVPMLAVDLNGNLYLKGSQNVKLYINDKPSALAVTSVADALKQIPADQIKSVEVMTSPPAKYDAEGAAGIVNIILKKSTEISSLSSNGSFEIRGSKVTLNGGMKRGKMTYAGSAFANYSYNHPGSFSNNQTTTDLRTNSTSTVNQQAATNFNSLRTNYSFNWDYDVSDKNSISSSVSYYNRIDNSFQDNLRTWNSGGDISLKDVKNDGGSNLVNFATSYQHLFSKPKKEFTMMALYNQGDSKSNFLTSILGPSDHSHLGYQKNLNNYTNREITIQADYQAPLGNNGLLDVGVKNIERSVSSQYSYFNAGSDNVFVVAAIPSLTNSLAYSQIVRAGYLSYDRSIARKYQVKAGVRYESTFIEATFGDQSKITIPSYSVVVPTLNLMKKIADGRTLKLSFNRRIQRPSTQYLNPNMQASNSRNVTVGNPGLSPEFTDNLDLSYSTSFKKSTLELSGFLQSTSNAIQSVKSILGTDTVCTTYRNTGKQKSLGTNIYEDLTLSKRIALSSNLNLIYTFIDGDDPVQSKTIHNEGFSHNINVSAKYRVNSSTRFELIVLNLGNTYFLQGQSRGWSIFNVSVKKDLPEKRGSVGITAANFVPGSVTMRSSVDSFYVHQQTANEIRNLNFKIFFSYQLISSKKNATTKTRKSISNDDLKGGTDQN
ncbi:TonB-dependent receptor [Cytophagales bacterium WSM2-2]|nr:TonB-dependent receptor [Cytophagales bacterium WSM2-2]